MVFFNFNKNLLIENAFRFRFRVLSLEVDTISV